MLVSNPKIHLEEIKWGSFGLTPSYGAHLLEGCMVSLYRNNHPAEVEMKIVGHFDMTVNLVWPSEQINEQIILCWADQDNATEQGAECIALLLIPRFTGMQLLRTYKGPGFDFHLGRLIDGKFNVEARLEVSGIFKGKKKEINKRENLKKKQTAKSDYTKLPAYISIIEFSQPQSKFFLRNEL